MTAIVAGSLGGLPESAWTNSRDHHRPITTRGAGYWGVGIPSFFATAFVTTPSLGNTSRVTFCIGGR